MRAQRKIWMFGDINTENFIEKTLLFQVLSPHANVNTYDCYI